MYLSRGKNKFTEKKKYLIRDSHHKKIIVDTLMDIFRRFAGTPGRVFRQKMPAPY